jgi:thiol:disulfide interchange protein DsbD
MLRAWPIAVLLLALGCSRADTSAAREPPVDTKEKDKTKTPPPPPALDAQAAATAAPLAWIREESVALAEAKKSKKRIFIDISAEWCAPCEELEKITFADTEVRKRLEGYVLLKIDVTEQSDKDKALQEKYKALMLPAVIVISPKGDELLRFDKFVEPAGLLSAIDALPPA